jgi:hypothetical protein
MENRLIEITGGASFVGACPELDSGMAMATG